jgi:hypothetical protein
MTRGQRPPAPQDLKIYIYNIQIIQQVRELTTTTNGPEVLDWWYWFNWTYRAHWSKRCYWNSFLQSIVYDREWINNSLIGFGGIGLTASGTEVTNTAFFTKYDSSGNPIWTTRAANSSFRAISEHFLSCGCYGSSVCQVGASRGGATFSL